MEFELSEYKKRVVEKSQEVTIFMLTHNREHYLKLAIDSVIRQSYDNFTLIILDNCSEDHTHDMVESINDSRIMYLYRQSTLDDPNVKFAQKICVTKYFIILHDDDILEDTYLYKVIRKMNKSHYAAVSVSCSRINERGEFTRKCDGIKEDIVFSGDQYFKFFMSNDSQSIIYPSVIYRTDFYKAFHGFWGDIAVGPCGDQYIWLETERAGQTLCIIGEELFRYRLHSDQESNQLMGMMGLQLFDFLLQDNYYIKLIFSVLDRYINKIWNINKSIAIRYAEGHLDRLEYKGIFERPSLQFLKNSFRGVLIYAVIKLMYFMRDFISPVIRRRKHAK